MELSYPLWLGLRLGLRLMLRLMRIFSPCIEIVRLLPELQDLALYRVHELAEGVP